MFYDMISSFKGDRGGRSGRESWRGGDGGGDEFGRGRKLSSEDLQLLILGLLETAPAHGYELMRRLEDHSAGFYIPSPGMIYPALSYLDDADQISAEVQGNRKRYRIAALGVERLVENRERVNHSMARLARIGSRMDEVREAFTGLHDMGSVDEELHAARHRLKRALFEKRGCAPDEARRIAAALNRLADDILQTDAQSAPALKG